MTIVMMRVMNVNQTGADRSKWMAEWRGVELKTLEIRTQGTFFCIDTIYEAL